MTGSLVHRGKNRWGLVLDLGYVTDPTTGTRRRKQKWITFRGDKTAAGKSSLRSWAPRIATNSSSPSR